MDEISENELEMEFEKVRSLTIRGETPCGRFYLVATVAFNPEVQLHLSGMDACQRSWLAAVDSLINMASKSYSLLEIARAMEGLKCGKAKSAAQNQGVPMLSCADSIATALKDAHSQIHDILEGN